MHVVLYTSLDVRFKQGTELGRTVIRFTKEAAAEEDLLLE